MDHNSKFIEYVTSVAEKHNVKLIVNNETSIPYPNSHMMCSGYFIDYNSPELGIAIGGDKEDWLPILVHEFSHMQQYLENTECWKNNFIDGIETIDIIDKWISGDDSITNIEDLISRSYAIEADCEKRSIENIKTFKLEIDIPMYYQKANSYILFYAAMLENRKWYNKYKKPYMIKEVWSVMPNDRIIEDWKTEYQLYKNVFNTYCF